MRSVQPGVARGDGPAGAAASWTRRDGLVWGLAACGLGLIGTAAMAQPASAAADEARAPPLPPLGSLLAMPPIALLKGGSFDPTTSRGQPLLVYWWSSTCPFCALQSPAMEAFWLAHRARGLQMVALSIDKRPQDAQAYLAAKGYGFPAAWAGPEWRRNFPKPKGLPITLLAGADGRVVVAEKGQMFAEDVAAMSQFL
jgi:hypothetical protein